MINENDKKNKNLNENNLNSFNFPNKTHSRNKSEDLKNVQVDNDRYKLTSTGEDKFSNFNPKDCDSILFQEKFEKKNKNPNNNETFINSVDNNDKTLTNNLSFSSSAKIKSKIPSSRALSSLMFSNYINMNNINSTKKKKIKKVTFKKNIVDVIEIESFKKYNLENGFNPDYKTDTKCSCIVF